MQRAKPGINAMHGLSTCLCDESMNGFFLAIGSVFYLAVGEVSACILALLDLWVVV